MQLGLMHLGCEQGEERILIHKANRMVAAFPRACHEGPLMQALGYPDDQLPGMSSARLARTVVASIIMPANSLVGVSSNLLPKPPCLCCWRGPCELPDEPFSTLTAGGRERRDRERRGFDFAAAGATPMLPL